MLLWVVVMRSHVHSGRQGGHGASQGRRRRNSATELELFLRYESRLVKEVSLLIGVEIMMRLEGFV
jgi:hypothetical protein